MRVLLSLAAGLRASTADVSGNDLLWDIRKQLGYITKRLRHARSLDISRYRTSSASQLSRDNTDRLRVISIEYVIV